jgi:hypothetical protein
MDMNWKEFARKKFSPLMGVEKSEEIISSIEEVYSKPEKYEDVINLIEYMLESSEENLQIYKKSLTYLQDAMFLLEEESKLNFVHVMSSITLYIILFFNRENIQNYSYYLLIGVLFSPFAYSIYRRLRDKWRFYHEQKK